MNLRRPNSTINSDSFLVRRVRAAGFGEGAGALHVPLDVVTQTSINIRAHKLLLRVSECEAVPEGLRAGIASTPRRCCSRSAPCTTTIHRTRISVECKICILQLHN